jgi:mRNA interferase HigB
MSYHMKVHLVKKQTIEEYTRENARSRPSFRLWLLTLNGVDWNMPEDMLTTFGSADLLGNGCESVVFEYTKVCKEKKQYSISIY